MPPVRVARQFGRHFLLALAFGQLFDTLLDDHLIGPHLKAFRMEVTEEEFGGTRVTLGPGDSLKSVPRSHRHLVTPEIKSWWADPVRAVRRVADSAVTPNMGHWFRRMADDGSWELRLHVADGVDVSGAGFRLSCAGIRGAEVGPPTTKPLAKYLPPDLAGYYRLVSFVSWGGFGTVGGLTGPTGHTPLSMFSKEYHGADVNPARTFVFGTDAGGGMHMVICTTDGRGGWLNFSEGEIILLGSVLDTIDWVYSELLADRGPDYFAVR
jgi:hypothetical protein